jgi:glutamine synthetase
LVKSLPLWNYDGSSTGQATGEHSEVIIQPVWVCRDPFRTEESYYAKLTNNSDFKSCPPVLVLCETFDRDGNPLPSNTRFEVSPAKSNLHQSAARFGFEQEFFLMRGDDLAYERTADDAQGEFYCSSGVRKGNAREVTEFAFKKCLLAGLRVTGMNAEVAPAQWEIQVSDIGIAACDQLIILRYILNRTAEEHGLWVNYHPKPKCIRLGDWNGSGCHANFSTLATMRPGGFQKILNIIDVLKRNHTRDMQTYGKDNDMRMTGLHETASFYDFTYGVGNRGTSIRIPTETAEKNYGYFEDRRPSSNCDPYLVAHTLLTAAKEVWDVENA